MHRCVTHGLCLLALTAAGTALTLAQEGWGQLDWRHATPAAVQERWRHATLATVQERLDRGAAPTARDQEGWTPLHAAAAFNKNPAVAALLLDRGAMVNARGLYDWTPLHTAAAHANPAAAALLLDRGAVINAQTDDGETPLHAAVMFNENPAFAALLLDRGAEVNARDRFGETPLHTAAAHADPVMAALLLNRGAAVNARTDDGKTPLHTAATHANLAVATLLLDRGAAVDARTDDGWTALYTATAHANPAVATLLLDRGADATLLPDEPPEAEEEEPGCVWGFSSVWTFDRATKGITLDQVTPREVCYYPHRPQTGANMRFVLRKDAAVVWTEALFLLRVLHYDYFDEHGNLQGGIVTDSGQSAHILAFPVDIQTVTHYEVIDIATHTTLGQGEIAGYEMDARLYTERGRVKQRLGQHAAALADYDRAIELNPTNATTYMQRGTTQAHLGRLPAARADYGHARALAQAAGNEPLLTEVEQHLRRLAPATAP